MKLLTNKKEAQVMQIALGLLIGKSDEHTNTAQALLARIARCLELQGNNDRAGKNSSKR